MKIRGKKKENLEKGRLGENIAKKYLQRRGYRMLDQNYRTPYAEIDLIAKHKDTLVFVEVRTKLSERFGTPEETINRDKIYRLIRNAQGYMTRKGYDKKCRIDAVCIVLDEDRNPKRIDHYENITFCFGNK